MSHANSQTDCDRLFDDYIHDRKISEAQRRLDPLFDHCILPAIQFFMRRKFSNARGKAAEQERDELQCEIIAQIVAAFQKASTSPATNGIHSWRGYILTIAEKAFAKHLQAKYPRRCSLVNNLRYLLDTTPGLARWQVETHEWCAGFQGWHGKPKADESNKKLQEFLAHPHEVFHKILPQEDSRRMDPRKLVASVLSYTGQPLALDCLVQLCAELWDVQDAPTASLNEEVVQRAASARDGEGVLTQQAALAHIWGCLCSLAPKMGAALLLHCRDANGNSLLDLLELEGVASSDEIASTMAMNVQQLTQLWNDLPLSDGQIAPMLGVLPNHVARLRMTARRLLEVCLHSGADAV